MPTTLGTIPQSTINTGITILFRLPLFVIRPSSQFNIFQGMPKRPSATIADSNGSFYFDDGLFVHEFEGVGAVLA
jgi:hypothetical protein